MSAEYASTPSRHRSDSDDRFCRDIVPLTSEIGRLARRLARSQVDAEDLVQETMLRAYRGFGGYRDGTNPRSWLCKILYNTWISSCRARQRRPLEQLTGEFTDQQIARGYQCSSSSSRSAEAEVLEACGDSETVSAFKSLPAEQRHAVYLADVEGLRYHEIARIMACPIGTVMSRVHRGRHRLRTLLATVANRDRLADGIDIDEHDDDGASTATRAFGAEAHADETKNEQLRMGELTRPGKVCASCRPEPRVQEVVDRGARTAYVVEFGSCVVAFGRWRASGRCQQIG